MAEEKKKKKIATRHIRKALRKNGFGKKKKTKKEIEEEALAVWIWPGE